MQFLLQIGGIRFLYDNLVESLNQFRNSPGFGCILAHSMGLGKTLQLISFTDIFMRYTGAKTVLCIVPINTLQNWVAEFDQWLPARNNQQVNTRPQSNESSRAGESSQDTNSEGQSNGQAGGVQKQFRTFRLFVVNDMHKTTDSRLGVIGKLFFCLIQHRYHKLQVFTTFWVKIGS